MAELRMSLNDPGMTAMHKAGLGGLAMSLQALGRQNHKIPDLEFEAGEAEVVLRFPDDRAVVLAEFVEWAMYCDKGLIRFRAFEDLSSYTQEVVLHLNEMLDRTLLQHWSSRVPPNADRAPFEVTIEDRTFVLNVRSLTSFAHRNVVREKLLDKKGGLVAKDVRVKGWALPGAAQRHAKIVASSHAEPPRRLLPLVFGPIGVIPFHISARYSGARASHALIIPEIESLEDFDRARRELVGGISSHTSSSVGDASLRFFMALDAAKLLRRLKIRGCVSIGLGSMPWASQQKTRTMMFKAAVPNAVTLRRFQLVERHMPHQAIDTREGRSFYDLPAWRRILTGNIAAQRPLWAGVFHAQLDRDNRQRLLGYERPAIAALTRSFIEEGILGQEAEVLFVNACHQAIRHRYGRLADRAEKEGIERTRLFETEAERMRVAIGRCKNAASFRAVMVDLWARGGRNATLQEHWQHMLRFLTEGDWALGRDLALLALASYAGAKSKTTEQQEEG